MEWTDEGLLLGIKRHGERSFVAEVLTRDHGRHLGLIRSVTKADRALFQGGNWVAATWRARLAQHLGAFQLEIIENRAPRMCENRGSLSLMNTIIHHIRLLAERDPHPDILALSEQCLAEADHSHNDCERLLQALFTFELTLLTELGFGLDLSTCALTGSEGALAWVSPMSGRAVSYEAGLPWADRLLTLPKPLSIWIKARNFGLDLPLLDRETLLIALELTGFFLNKNVYQDHYLPWPLERAWLIDKNRNISTPSKIK